jgi:cytochrome oxidase assembly protein ShyY1
VAVIATLAAVALGLWQYDVWQSHRQAQSSSLAGAAPRPLDSVMSADDPFPRDDVGRPVRVSGRWLPADTLFVSGRELHGRRGSWVVTPLEVCRPPSCTRAPAVLVVRGWVADRGAAPSAPGGEVEVTGWLQPGEGSGNPDPDPGDDVLPQLRIADALQHVSQDLYGGYVIAKVPHQAGLSPVTPASLPKAPSFTAVRNLLYALEWWVFGGFAVYLWGRWCRDELQRGFGVAAGPDDDDHPQESQVTGVPSKT